MQKITAIIAKRNVRDYMLNLPFSNGKCDYACLLNRHVNIILLNMSEINILLSSCFRISTYFNIHIYCRLNLTLMMQSRAVTFRSRKIKGKTAAGDTPSSCLMCGDNTWYTFCIRWKGMRTVLQPFVFISAGNGWQPELFLISIYILVLCS